MRKIFSLLLVLTFLLSAAACSSDNAGEVSQELNFTVGGKSSASKNTTQSSSAGNLESGIAPKLDTESSKDESRRINGSNIYDMDESFSQYGMYINNVKVYKGKTLPEAVEMKNFLYFDYGDQTDGEGRLLPETSYFFIDMDVRNDTETDVSLSWNASVIILTDDDHYVASLRPITTWEARYRSGKEYDDASKDYFMQTISPHEEVSVKIGFVIDDQYIDDPNLFFAPVVGLSGDLYDKRKVYRLNGKDAGL